MRITFDPTTDSPDAVRRIIDAAFGPAPVSVPEAPVAVTPAPVVPEAPAPEIPRMLDSKGTPWDVRIHSSSKATNADGTWRRGRNVALEDFNRVMAEIAPHVAPVPVPAAPVPVPPVPAPAPATAVATVPVPPVPVAPAAPASAAITAKDIVTLSASKGIKVPNDLLPIIQQFGFESVVSLFPNNNPEQWALDAVYAAISER